MPFSEHHSKYPGGVNAKDYMPGGSLGTKPVHVTPLAAKDVLAAAAQETHHNDCEDADDTEG